MKKNILRISIMAVMVILGLTAVAPEWLELKDMIIADQLAALKNAQETVSSYLTSIGDALTGVSEAFYSISAFSESHKCLDAGRGVLSSVNCQVLGGALSFSHNPGGIRSPVEALVAPLFWLMEFVTMYSLFLASNYIVYSSFKKIGNHFSISLPGKNLSTKEGKLTFKAFFLVLSFGVTFCLWLLPLMIIMIATFLGVEIYRFWSNKSRR